MAKRPGESSLLFRQGFKQVLAGELDLRLAKHGIAMSATDILKGNAWGGGGPEEGQSLGLGAGGFRFLEGRLVFVLELFGIHDIDNPNAYPPKVKRLF